MPLNVKDVEEEVKRYITEKHGKECSIESIKIKSNTDEKLLGKAIKDIEKLCKENKKNIVREISCEIYPNTILTAEIYLSINEDNKPKLYARYYDLEYNGKEKKQNSFMNDIFNFYIEILDDQYNPDYEEKTNDFKCFHKLLKKTQAYIDFKKDSDNFMKSFKILVKENESIPEEDLICELQEILNEI